MDKSLWNGRWIYICKPYAVLGRHRRCGRSRYSDSDYGAGGIFGLRGDFCAQTGNDKEFQGEQKDCVCAAYPERLSGCSDRSVHLDVSTYVKGIYFHLNALYNRRLNEKVNSTFSRVYLSAEFTSTFMDVHSAFFII